jgi:hypothetical protein
VCYNKYVIIIKLMVKVKGAIDMNWKPLVGIFCLLYAVIVGYFAYKKSPGLIKLVKMKLGKKMTDKTAIIVCYVMAVIMLVLGILFFTVF